MFSDQRAALAIVPAGFAPVALSQRGRVNRQLEQCHIRRQGLIEDGRGDIGVGGGAYLGEFWWDWF